MTDFYKQQCLIGGKWLGSGDTAITNPATDEEIAKVPNFGADEANQAIAAATKAFGTWSKTLAKERSAVLRRWYELMVENADELAALLTREQGKPLAEAKGEILYGASFIEYYAEEAKRIYGETIPSPFPDGRIVVIRQPIGVVAAITPWNFPAAMITRKVAPAFAAGLHGGRQAGSRYAIDSLCPGSPGTGSRPARRCIECDFRRCGGDRRRNVCQSRCAGNDIYGFNRCRQNSDQTMR